ncbi:Mitochondrial dicarboxylate transporter [Ceratocystis lukuohia]|uniref:Mitochondrial dicarboxylate transporter n=2 Tax=Ceratocystis TaxID=5157 RepID=A0A0F8DL03_CERFI|nr:Mitochondrial dicarboxylate transporter [Ceratocystis platani]
MEATKAAAPAASVAKPSLKIQKKEVKSSAVKYPFWFGGSASSMAACVTHPLDLGIELTHLQLSLQVRLQMRTADAPKTMYGTFKNIIKHNGALGVYSGLSASLLRQMTYSTVRFGVYEELKTRFTSTDGKPPSFGMLIALSSFAGFLGGISGNVADVLNVRMQHDTALPPDQRRNYKHALDGMARMAREEGIKSWFRGVWPNSTRAIFMTSSQLASYDIFKRLLLNYTPMGDTLSTHFSASFLAGVVAATVTSPVDVIKTRVMSSTADHSITHLFRDLYRADGLRWMFKGWTPSFLRLGPQTICTFLFLEGHRSVYRKLAGLPDV